MANVTNTPPAGQPQILSVTVNQDSQSVERNDVNQKKALTEKNNTRNQQVADKVALKGVTALVGKDGVAGATSGALAAAAQTAAIFQPLQASEISTSNTPKGITEFALAFNTMEVGKPSGTEIGNPLKNWQPNFKSGAVAPSLVFSAKTFAEAIRMASSEPRAQPKPGTHNQMRDPQELKQERAAAFAKMLGPQESAAATVAFSKLSPSQQAAVQQLARKLSGDDLRHELRRPVDASELRLAKDMLAPAASGLLKHQRIGALVDDSGDERALLDGEPLTSVATDEAGTSTSLVSNAAETSEAAAVDSLSALVSASRDARAENLDEVVVPSPFLVKLEQSFSDGLPFDLANVDVMVLAQMVLAQIGKAAEQDLRDVMKEMQDTNRKNDQLRTQMQQQREMQTQIDSQLNDRYHQRTGLDPKDPLYINPNLVDFDRFKSLQKIEVTGTADNPSYGLSPNEPRFPRSPEEVRDADGAIITQRDVDLANMAGISPQQMAFLRKLYNDPTSKDAWYAKHSDFESFLAVEVGLQTPVPDGVNQNVVVMEWRNANDPVAIARAMADKFGVSESELGRLQRHWQTQLSSSERGASFESWLTSSVGLVAGQSTQNSQKILDFDAQLVAAEAARASSQEESALIREFGVSAGDLELVRQYLSIVNDRDASLADVRSFLTTSSRGGDRPGIGMQAGAANHARNRERMQEWVNTQQAELNTGSAFPNGETSLEETLDNISVSSGELQAGGRDPSRNNKQDIGNANRALLADGQAQVDAYLATLPPEVRAETEARMRTYVRDYLAAVRRENPEGAAAATRALKDWMGQLQPESARGPVANYITMQMVAVGNELTVCAKFGRDTGLPSSSYLFESGAMTWDTNGAGKARNEVDGKEVDGAQAQVLLDALLATAGDWTRTAKEHATAANTELANLFTSNVREATASVLVTPGQILPGGLGGTPHARTVDELLASIQPTSLRQQLDNRVKEYTAQLMRNLDGAGADAEAFATLTNELKQFVDAIRPASAREKVAGYVAMRMAQVSAEASVIAGNENTELDHESFLRQSGALQYGGRMPGGRSFTPGSGYDSWVDSNEARNAQRKFATLSDEWAGHSEGYADPDAERRSGGLRSLFRRGSDSNTSSPSPFVMGALLTGSFGGTALNIAVGGAPEASPATVPREPTPEQLATADLFRVQMDHSTAQGERLMTREITFAQMGADLDALKDKKDSQSAMGEMISLRLQMYMDRRQKIMETMSNAFKKSADTQSGIISNLK